MGKAAREEKDLKDTVTDATEPVLPVVEQLPLTRIDDSIMSLDEFASSLKGTDLLMATAMRKEYGAQRMIKSSWVNALKKFSLREV